MSVTISKLNVILSGSMGGLESVMHGAEGTIHGFEHTVEHASHHVFELLAAMGLGLSLEGFAEYLKGTFEAIISTEKLALTTGIATEEIGKLHYAASLAGVSNDDLDTAIKKMLGTMFQAANGSKEAAAAYRALGLDAKELANLPTAQAFEEVADALRKETNATELNGAAKAIFGKAYATIIPLLRESKDHFDEAATEAETFGLALKGIDVAQVELAHKSIARLEGALQGAADQLIVHLSPYISAATNDLVRMGTSGQDTTERVTHGFGAVVEGIAYASDLLKFLKGGWDYLAAGATAAVFLIVKGLDELVHVASNVIEALGGEKLDTSFLDQYTDGLAQDTKKLFHEGNQAFADGFNGENAKAAKRYFADIERGAKDAAAAAEEGTTKLNGALDELGDNEGAKKATEALASLQKQVDEFGLSKGQKAAHDVADAGGSPEQQAEAKALAEKLDGLESVKKAQDEMAQDAKKIWEETRTPAEKYADQIEKINALLKDNKITKDQAAAARTKADEDLAKGIDEKGSKAEGPKLLVAGSQDVAKFAAEAQQRQRVEQHNREALAEAKKQSELLGKIKDAVTTAPADTNEAATIV